MTRKKPERFEVKPEDLLNAGMKAAQELAPHTDQLIDAAIILGLYQIGKQVGNPWLGPISYKLATGREEVIPTLELAWGATKIPASIRMIGVLGLTTLGAAIAFGQPVVNIPPPVTKGDIEDVIDKHTTTTDGDGDEDGDEDGDTVTDWKAVADDLATKIKTPYLDQNMAAAIIGDLARERLYTVKDIPGAERYWTEKTGVSVVVAKAARDWWMVEAARRGDYVSVAAIEKEISEGKLR